jgi:hypothetical protein
MKAKSMLRKSLFFIIAMAMLFAFTVTAYASAAGEDAPRTLADMISEHISPEAGQAYADWAGSRPPSFSLGLLIAVIVLPLLIVTQTYGRSLRKKYGFKMFLNWPGYIAMGCFGIAVVTVWFEIIKFDLSDPANQSRLPLLLLAVGAPGMIPYFINCWTKTKNIIHALITTAFMYPFYLVFGGVVGTVVFVIFLFYIAILCIGGGLGNALGGGGSGSKAQYTTVCARCGSAGCNGGCGGD